MIEGLLVCGAVQFSQLWYSIPLQSGGFAMLKPRMQLDKTDRNAMTEYNARKTRAQVTLV